MARLGKRTATRKARIAVIDDDKDLLTTTVALFEREGHEVQGTQDSVAGVRLVQEWQPELLLLDYCMPGMSGPEAVRAIRQFDPLVQVLLVTGYAEEHPARTLLGELDIQGFHDKTDGPQRLLVLADAALKHYQSLASLDRQRRGLLHIVEASPKLTRLQPMEALFQVALSEVRPLLGGGDGLVATQNSGLFVFERAAEGVVIRAGSGQYSGHERISDIAGPMSDAIRRGLGSELPSVHGGQFVLLPMWTRDQERGCIVVEGNQLTPEAVELCRIYGQQVVQALENLALWERATTDGLTRLYNRAFGMQRLDEVLSLDIRQKRSTSVLMMDVDHFKSINDMHGHAAGDLALRAVAGAIRSVCRISDVAARWGGEEMLMVLPDTGIETANVVAERVRAAVEALRIPFEGKEIRPTISIGVATAGTGICVAPDSLVTEADCGLYDAKRSGRNRVCDGRAALRSAA